jgi:hypothetical protein
MLAGWLGEVVAELVCCPLSRSTVVIHPLVAHGPLLDKNSMRPLAERSRVGDGGEEPAMEVVRRGSLREEKRGGRGGGELALQGKQGGKDGPVRAEIGKTVVREYGIRLKAPGGLGIHLTAPCWSLGWDKTGDP